MTELKIGATYQHFKGKLYRVLAVARHSETLEQLVVYQALYDSSEYGTNSYWVRPVSMFCESVMHNGQAAPRFKLIQD
jgi:hypothetical protein